MNEKLHPMLDIHVAAIEAQYSDNLRKWGPDAPSPSEHLVIAAEEFGEVARAMQTDAQGCYEWPPIYSERVYHELVDLGAVILAMMVNCRALDYTGEGL